MKQLLQNLRSGETELADIPCPQARPGQVLIRTTRSLISSGTERMLVDFGRANLVDKARQQPDKVQLVFDKIKTDGLIPTIEAVLSKLDRPLPLGYCNVGIIEEVGAGVTAFAVGDRVVSNGRHAEIVAVPQNLCARIPDGVTDDAAVFTVIGAIALQGLRLAQPTLGETFVVTGLGVVGLLAVQLLRAQGCRVLGIDYDQRKVDLAKSLGAEVIDLSVGADPLATAQRVSRGRGVDGVLLAAATTSNEPVHQAARMCRKRGRIVLIGEAGLELTRADFYEKELTFQVSCSYGPGRYDPQYEEKNQDYPVGFVRWTAQRNFEAVLDMLADGRLDGARLISHRFPLDQAPAAYGLLMSATPHLGIVLDYPTREASSEALARERVRFSAPVRHERRRPVVGVIGAGDHAHALLLPAFREAGARLKTIVSSGGVNAAHAARKFGFEEAATVAEAVLADPEIDVAVIATRHDSHARLVCQALEAGKNVFVEKPLALDRADLQAIEAAYTAASSQRLMVGFNRRFAPHVLKMRALLATRPESKAFVITVNAGAVPVQHWTQDPVLGGGRIVGEACHFIDLLRHLSAAPIVKLDAVSLGNAGDRSRMPDTVNIILRFGDDSIGAIHYLANGHKSFPKERVEVFCGARVLQLDNFRVLRGYGWPRFSRMQLWRQDKGNSACVQAFVDALANGSETPISFDELREVAEASFQVMDSIKS